MKDVLQLTTAIVMASSAKKKNKTPRVFKHLEGGLLVIISLLKLMTRPIAHYENTRSGANIFSPFSLVGSKRCLEFLTY